MTMLSSIVWNLLSEVIIILLLNQIDLVSDAYISPENSEDDKEARQDQESNPKLLRIEASMLTTTQIGQRWIYKSAIYDIYVIIE